MTFLVERLADLRRHLDHVEGLRQRVTAPEDLTRNLSLHNDVLFSLLTICQLVIDISGELAARRGDRFEDYVGAVRSLLNCVRTRVAPSRSRLVRRLPNQSNPQLGSRTPHLSPSRA